MKTLKGSLAVICSLFLFISCKKDSNDTIAPDVNGFAIPASSPVSGKMTGIVTDENNNAVLNATVVFGSASLQTNAQGFFQLNDVVMDKYVTTVTVSKSGYFKAYRSFSATPGRNFLSIKLIPKVLAGAVQSANGGTATLPDGTSVSLPANGIVIKSSGAPYNGTVNIYAAYIDPTTSDFFSRVPGSMMGKDDRYMYVLQSAGMMAVDLESPSGESLQLAPSHPASLSIPIPSSLLSKAPDAINTWSLDENGIWVKEGVAAKHDNHYELSVPHFSFWNCDGPANAIYLTIHVVNQNNQPLSNSVVQLSIPNNNTWWATTAGITDSSGTVAGLVPANQVLELAAYANSLSCTAPFYSQNIGSFSQDASISITVTLTPSQAITVSGAVTDCNSQPLASGSAAVLAGPYNIYYAPVTNGNYSIMIPTCYASTIATVVVGDSIAGTFSNPVTVTLTGTNVTVPTQMACGGVAAAYTFSGYPSSCPVYTLQGTYATGIAVTSSNFMIVPVDVTAVGSYFISTGTADGIRFTATGTFTSTGTQNVTMLATGTPLGAGTFPFIPVGAGSNSQGCTRSITVN